MCQPLGMRHPGPNGTGKGRNGLTRHKATLYLEPLALRLLGAAHAPLKGKSWRAIRRSCRASVSAGPPKARADRAELRLMNNTSVNHPQRLSQASRRAREANLPRYQNQQLLPSHVGALSRADRPHAEQLIGAGFGGNDKIVKEPHQH